MASVAPVATTDAAGRPARLEAADALRALATVLVVIIHTTHWPSPARLYADLDLLSRLAVPVFMVLTGVLLTYGGGAGREPVASFLRRRFSRSLLPWLAWAPVYAVAGWFLTGDVPHSAAGLGTFLSYGAGHLWFLLLIPQMYLLHLVWPRQRLWAWAAAALAVQSALAVYRLYGPMPPGVDQVTLWHGFQLLPFWVGYFAVGIAAGRELATRGAPRGAHPLVLAVAAAGAVAGGVLLVAVNYDAAPHAAFQQGTGGFLLPQEPLFVFAVAVLVLFTAPALRGRRGSAPLTSLLSGNSLGVYILHPILVYLVARRVEALLFTGLPLSLLGFAVITLAGLVGATVLSVVLSATPLAATLGVRWRRRR